MISVLLPTRLRPGPLARSVGSLLATASEPFEVLLAVDEDDPTAYERFADCTAGLAKVRVWRTPRHGYAQLHRYYNELAARAAGDWLLLWNDDCVMQTVGWDRIVERHERRHVLAPHSENDPLCTFPIIPASFARAVGHYAEILHVDTWWQDLAGKLGILEWIDVRLSHRRPDLVEGVDSDEVYEQRAFVLHELYEPPMQARHDRDVEIVRALIALERAS